MEKKEMNLKGEVTQEQYQALKTTDLNFKERSKKWLSEDEIKFLNFQSVLYPHEDEEGNLVNASFANFCSFTYFPEQALPVGADAKINVKNNIRIIQNWNELQKEGAELKCGYVLLGVNAGEKAKNITYDDFENFQDYTKGPSPIKIARALKTMNEQDITDLYDNVFNGAYITDYVKGFPTKTEKELKDKLEYIKKGKDDAVKEERGLGYSQEEYDVFFVKLSKLYGEILLDELALLGNQTHTLLVLGAPNDPKDWIVNKLIEKSGMFGDYAVGNIYHYSGVVKYQKISDRFKKVISMKNELI